MEDKFSILEIAEIMQIEPMEVCERLIDLYRYNDKVLNVTSNDVVFTTAEVESALKHELYLIDRFSFKVEQMKAVLNSQQRAGFIFDDEDGIKSLKFPPHLKIYERLLSKDKLDRILVSWKRKNEYLYGNTNPTIQ